MSEASSAVFYFPLVSRTWSFKGGFISRLSVYLHVYRQRLARAALVYVCRQLFSETFHNPAEDWSLLINRCQADRDAASRGTDGTEAGGE